MNKLVKFSFAIHKNLISLSPNAANRIKLLISQQSEANIVYYKYLSKTAVKIGVKTRGCNGLSYTMNYCDKHEKFDEVVEEHGVRVIIDSKAVMVLVGTTMDYIEDDIKSEFVFRNPNEKGSCGCGESFHV